MKVATKLVQLPCPDSVAREAPGVRFIELSEMLPIDDGSERQRATAFLAVGYPDSKQPRTIRESGYAPFAYHFVTHLIEPKHALDIAPDPDLHLVVGYDRKDFVGDPRVTMMPDPVGMSGGGLWQTPDWRVADAPTAKLVGILTRFRSSGTRALIATRIIHPLRALRKLDPATSGSIDDVFPELFVAPT